jgi:hypothetical protein
MPASPSDNCSPTARSPVHRTPSELHNKLKHPFLIPQTHAGPANPTTPSTGSVQSRLMRTLSARMRTTVSSTACRTASPPVPCPRPPAHPHACTPHLVHGTAQQVEPDCLRLMGARLSGYKSQVSWTPPSSTSTMTVGWSQMRGLTSSKSLSCTIHTCAASRPWWDRKESDTRPAVFAAQAWSMILLANYLTPANLPVLCPP